MNHDENKKSIAEDSDLERTEFSKEIKKEDSKEEEKADSNEESEDDDSDDHEFSWYNADTHDKETYFTIVNHDRRTMQPGEQAWYCYGNRSNKFLLINYGFCFAGNRLDSL